MAKLVNFFPLSVYIGEVQEHEALKERFVPLIGRLAAEQASGNVWTGDVKGHGFIHLDSDYGPLLDALVPHVYGYLEMLKLDTEKLDVFFQRSWPVVARRDQQIAVHQHAHAHISLVYYLNKPERAGGIRLLQDNAPNELVPHLFQQSFFVERTTVNSSQVDVNANEGQVLIFPAKTWHSTIPAESDEDRISIVADIAIMLNDESEGEHMMPAFSLWKKL